MVLFLSFLVFREIIAKNNPLHKRFYKIYIRVNAEVFKQLKYLEKIKRTTNLNNYRLRKKKEIQIR